MVVFLCFFFTFVVIGAHLVAIADFLIVLLLAGG